MAPSRTISLKLVPVYLLVFHLVSLMLIGVNITRDQNRGDAFYGQNQAPSAALTLLLNYENHWGWSGDPYDIDYGSDMWVNETVIYLVGHNTTATKGTQFVIGKFTHDGSEIWNASWGGFVSGSDEAQAVWADSTGVYVTGFTYSYGAGGGKTSPS